MTNKIKALNVTDPTYIEFAGTRILAVAHEGREYVAVKPVCEGIGLAWTAQYERIQRDAVLAEGIRVIRIPSAGGVQETICLPLEMLNGWLFGVDDKRVKETIREKLIFYKQECYRVLHRHFFAEPPVQRHEHVHIHHHHFYFNGVEFLPVNHEGDYWYDAEAIGHALGFNGHTQRECVRNLYQENREAFEGLSKLIRLPRAAGRRHLRMYNREGMEKLAEISRAPYAEAFHEFLKSSDAAGQRSGHTARPTVEDRRREIVERAIGELKALL